MCIRFFKSGLRTAVVMFRRQWKTHHQIKPFGVVRPVDMAIVSFRGWVLLSPGSHALRGSICWHSCIPTQSVGTRNKKTGFLPGFLFCESGCVNQALGTAVVMFCRQWKTHHQIKPFGIIWPVDMAMQQFSEQIIGLIQTQTFAAR